MFRHISKYSWFSFLPFLMLGVLTVLLLVMGIIPVWYLWFTFIGWVLIPGLGVATGYHRIFAHNNYPTLPKWKENLLLLLGTLSGQGSSITWTAIHRGYHHKYSDTARDLHSPIHGLYHAFFGWTTKINEASPIVNLKYAANLLRKPNHVWFHKHQMTILWVVPLLIAVLDWKLSLSLLCLPTALALLQDNLVNVFGHIKGGIGYRNYDTSDNSMNNVLFGYLGWGQGWHNNHHYDPKSFDFGTSVSGIKWEFDPCVLFKPFLK